MIKFAVTRPKERIAAINNGIGMLEWDKDPVLKHYGITVDPTMTLTNARLLANPEIQFNGSKINPLLTGRWDLRGKKFYKVNPVPLKSWGVCVVENCVDTPTVHNWVKVFIQTYFGHGGVISNKAPVIFQAGHIAELSDVVTDVRKQIGTTTQLPPQLIFFVLKDRSSIVYQRLKKNMECRYGMMSQSKYRTQSSR